MKAIIVIRQNILLLWNLHIGDCRRTCSSCFCPRGESPRGPLNIPASRGCQALKYHLAASSVSIIHFHFHSRGTGSRVPRNCYLDLITASHGLAASHEQIGTQAEAK